MIKVYFQNIPLYFFSGKD